MAKPESKNPRLDEILGGQTFMTDHAAIIAQSMGGRDFFVDIDSHTIHRVGRAAGLAWLVPTCKRGVNYVRVVARVAGRKDSRYSMLFGVITQMNETIVIESKHSEENVPYDKLREVYDRETIDDPE